jgi:hypothetical protein
MTRDGRESHLPVGQQLAARTNREAGTWGQVAANASVLNLAMQSHRNGPRDRLDQATARHRLDLPSIHETELQ